MFLVSSMLVAAALVSALAIARPSLRLQLDVPIVVRGLDRSGPASLAMVLAYYGADSSVQRRTDEAFDTKLGAASIKDLAATAARLGYPARIAHPGIDSLVAFLRSDVPPIVCVDPKPGVKGSSRYYVITLWDTLGNRFFGRDGGPRARQVPVPILQSLWEPGGKALIVTRPRR
jgi:hypothetical protein